MTTLTSFFKTDLVDDHVAADVNKLIAAALRAEYANTETITATKELTDNDCQFQFITPSGADRTVELSPESTSNHVTIIQNAGTSNQVIVKDDSGTTVLATLSRGEWAMFLPFGGTTWKRAAGSGETSTLIDGMQLIWDSATSISVGVGSCYAEVGDFIDVTSVIVKSGLSLSTSTWYHVYVYLSSGAPAAEVVTTAPVAWKGIARSKTSDATRRYVGSVLTDGSGNVREFQHNPDNNLIVYRTFYSNASPFLVLSGGSATTATAVSLTGIIPVTCKLPYIRLVNVGNTTAYISNSNGVGATEATFSIDPGNTAAQSAYAYQPIDSSQQFWYKHSTTGGALYASVLGYLFER